MSTETKPTMYTYYELTAFLDGETCVLFGSYDKNDVDAELESEREILKSEGYKRIRVTSRKVTEKPYYRIYGKNVG